MDSVPWRAHGHSFRPQSDGLVERFNRTLLNMLSVFVHDKPNTWDDHLPYVLSAYRSSVHDSTKCTPNCLVYARETNLPIDLMLPPTKGDEAKAESYPEYVQFVCRALQTAHTFARRHLGKALICQKRNYDSHTKSRSAFQVGDLVRYYYVPIKTSHKFAHPWIGPFKVLAKVTEVDYCIGRVSRPKDTRVVHVDHLKPYEKDDYLPVDHDLPALVLDHDYVVEEVESSMKDYQDFLLPVDDGDKDQVSGSEVETPRDQKISDQDQTCSDQSLAMRRARRQTKAPSRYGFSSNQVQTKSVYWF